MIIKDDFKIKLKKLVFNFNMKMIVIRYVNRNGLFYLNKNINFRLELIIWLYRISF